LTNKETGDKLYITWCGRWAYLPDQARACYGNGQNSAFTDGDVEEPYSSSCSGVFPPTLTNPPPNKKPAPRWTD